jgi:hypothetical protein
VRILGAALGDAVDLVEEDMALSFLAAARKIRRIACSLSPTHLLTMDGPLIRVEGGSGFVGDHPREAASRFPAAR